MRIKAVRNSCLETVTALLQELNPGQRLAAINIQDNDGNTALIWATHNGHSEIVTTLLQGLTPEQKLEAINIQNNDGYTALILAARKNHSEIVTTLLQGLTPEQRLAAIKIQDNNSGTALIEAARGSRSEIVTTLLHELNPEQQLKAINIQDNDGDTALILAAIHGHSKTITNLLQGLKPEQKLKAINIQNNDGDTALIWAAMRGHPEALSILLNAPHPLAALEKQSLDLMNTRYLPDECKKVIQNKFTDSFIKPHIIATSLGASSILDKINKDNEAEQRISDDVFTNKVLEFLDTKSILSFLSTQKSPANGWGVQLSRTGLVDINEVFKMAKTILPSAIPFINNIKQKRETEKTRIIKAQELREKIEHLLDYKAPLLLTYKPTNHPQKTNVESTDDSKLVDDFKTSLKI